SDKAQVLRLAERCGYAVPETRFIATWGERDGVPPDAGFFPAVIKPHRSVVSVAGVRRKLLVTPVADAVACHRALDALPAAAFPVLLRRGGVCPNAETTAWAFAAAGSGETWTICICACATGALACRRCARSCAFPAVTAAKSGVGAIRCRSWWRPCSGSASFPRRAQNVAPTRHVRRPCCGRPNDSGWLHRARLSRRPPGRRVQLRAPRPFGDDVPRLPSRLQVASRCDRRRGAPLPRRGRDA